MYINIRDKPLLMKKGTGLKILIKSKRAQTDITRLSQFAVDLLIVGIVVVLAFLLMGSFQSTLTANYEATAAVNTTIDNVNSAFNTIASLPPLVLVVAAVIVIPVIAIAFNFRRTIKKEESYE